MIRFLLLSDARSGTMMLADAIDELSCVALHNLYAANPQNPKGSHRNWIEFQRKREEGITHKGTTMHRVGDGWVRTMSPIPVEVFWETVNRQHEKVICLHRENLLRRFLSQKVGVVLKSYGVHQPRTKDPGSIKLPLLELVEFIGATEILHEKIDVFFPDALIVTYEELDLLWESTIEKIAGYLQLPEVPRKQVTIKQETRPLIDAIENYREIAAYLTEQGLSHWLK